MNRFKYKFGKVDKLETIREREREFASSKTYKKKSMIDKLLSFFYLILISCTCLSTLSLFSYKTQTLNLNLSKTTTKFTTTKNDSNF